MKKKKDVILKIDAINKTFAYERHLWNFFQKKFEHQVLKNCSLDVKSGDIFGLVGLNGIGKTTLIKIILDILDADSGIVELFGIDSKNAEARKQVCYLPEKFLPSKYLTGYEFLSLSQSFFGKKLDKSKADKIAKKLDLDCNVLNRLVKSYSKGMGQKLGLMSCLLSEAKLLILDEPVSGLDPKARFILKQALKDYVKEGKSIFLSSHLLDDVEEMCDAMAVLSDGKILFTGSPKDFREKFVADTAEQSFLKCIKFIK
jgi:ABC-2 type transport system ATP-binding protein